MKQIYSILILMLISTNIFSQIEQGKSGNNKVNIWGNFFGDYYYKAGGDSTNNNLQYSPYNKEFNAFAFRRMNLGFDYTLSRKFDTRFSISYDGPDTLPDGNVSVYIRDAFIKWNNVFTNSYLLVGIIPTPAYGFVEEKFWEYRSVEKTIMDQRSIVSSRDMGIMLAGDFDDAANYGYYAMIGNGSGVRLENNQYKKFYGNLFGYFEDKKIGANLYADYTSSGNDQSKTTLSAFVGYQNNAVSMGMLNFFQLQNNFNRSQNAANPDIVPYGLSVFFDQIIVPELKYFIRYDFYNQDINNSSTGFYQSFVTAGLDIMPESDFHIMPNIWLNAFTPKPNQNTKYTTDVVPRVSFWYNYK